MPLAQRSACAIPKTMFAMSARARAIRDAPLPTGGPSAGANIPRNPETLMRTAVLRDDSLDEEGVEQEEREPETLSRFEKLKRKHAKDKADRKFARQYGGNGDAASGEGGSRAAVYKGEMGLGASPFFPHAERGITVRVATHPRR